MTLVDALDQQVSSILSQSGLVVDGRSVPSTEDVGLAAGGTKLDATVLYADLSESSKLATEFHQKTAARVIRSFLYCMSRLIAEHQGTVTSFDGDRVMGVFIGDAKNTQAATCGLKMNYAVSKIIGPKVEAHFASLREEGFQISHCVGIDSSSVLAIRAGQRGSNDIVWVGRAPNLAAKLSELREDPFRTYISGEVFDVMNESAKFGGTPQQLMWRERSYQFVGEPITVHSSSWTWRP